MDDKMTWDELNEALIEGVQEGLFIAFLEDDGDLAFISTQHAKEHHRANALTLLEIQTYQATQGFYDD